MAKLRVIAGATIVFLSAWALPQPVPVAAGAPDSHSWPSALDARFSSVGEGEVSQVVDSATVVLDGQVTVRLAGVEPLLELSGPGAAARDALADLVVGRAVRLLQGRTGEPRRDRHARIVAQVVRADGLWVQGALVAEGQLRVRSLADDRDAAAELLGLERRARQAENGLWADPRFAVREAERAAEHLHQFALVEGRVLAAAVVRGRGYLNFGEDWRTDFTVSAAPRVMRLFAREGADWAGYEGRRIRVRGWLRAFDGPRIDVTHPEQIEFVDTTP